MPDPARRSAGLTLDAGALIAIERRDRRVTQLVERARRRGEPVAVPASALAQVLRNPSRQVELMRLLRAPLTSTLPLDRSTASVIGQLLARTGTTDVVDAHVAVCAGRLGNPVVTSDPDDLLRLDPGLVVIAC